MRKETLLAARWCLHRHTDTVGLRISIGVNTSHTTHTSLIILPSPLVSLIYDSSCTCDTCCERTDGRRMLAVCSSDDISGCMCVHKCMRYEITDTSWLAIRANGTFSQHFVHTAICVVVLEMSLRVHPTAINGPRMRKAALHCSGLEMSTYKMMVRKECMKKLSSLPHPMEEFLFLTHTASLTQFLSTKKEGGKVVVVVGIGV